MCNAHRNVLLFTQSNTVPTVPTMGKQSPCATHTETCLCVRQGNGRRAQGASQWGIRPGGTVEQGVCPLWPCTPFLEHRGDAFRPQVRDLALLPSIPGPFCLFRVDRHSSSFFALMQKWSSQFCGMKGAGRKCVWEEGRKCLTGVECSHALARAGTPTHCFYSRPFRHTSVALGAQPSPCAHLSEPGWHWGRENPGAVAQAQPLSLAFFFFNNCNCHHCLILEHFHHPTSK